MLKPLLLILASMQPASPGSAPPAGPAPEVVAGFAEELPANYEPARLKGYGLMIRADWQRNRPAEVRRILAALETDLDVINAALPGPAAEFLRHRVTIWVSPSLQPRAGFSGRGMCFHASEAWVSGNGLGAARAGGIEICNAEDYLLWRAEQPMMVLHELAHAYHDAIRPADRDIRAAFDRAVTAGRYECVRYILAGPDERRRAYAINNELEYFAELSEACFGRNDFEPMTRAELSEFDPQGLAAVERAWSNPSVAGVGAASGAERPGP